MNGMGDYLELKTSKRLFTERDKASFRRYKSIKFWAQSFLAGITEIVVGWRDDKGILVGVERMETRGIPRSVRGHRDTWVCMSMLDERYILDV